MRVPVLVLYCMSAFKRETRLWLERIIKLLLDVVFVNVCVCANVYLGGQPSEETSFVVDCFIGSVLSV